VVDLLRYRDFNRWLLPLKGEELRANGWVLFIPLLQYTLGLGVVIVSCTVTCGTMDAFEIVLNSLAFTFISQVAKFFNEPLLHRYSRLAISGLDPAEYGDEPIYYIVTEYDPNNATVDWEGSWYIREDESVAGLLTDFKFRHDPGSYATPNAKLIRWLRYVFFCVPPAVMALCYYLFTVHTVPNTTQ